MVNVTMTRGSWQAVYAILLEHGARCWSEGDAKEARKTLNVLAPVLRAAAGEAPRLHDSEQRIREATGFHVTPAVMAAARELVEESDDAAA